MKSFLIQSFTGLSDYEDKGQKGAFKFASGLEVRSKRDSLKAGQGLATDLATSGVMTAPVVAVVNASDGNSYWGLSNGRILKRTSAGVWSLVYTDADGSLTGMAEWGNDQGESGIYYATTTKLHRKPFPGNATWATDMDDDTAGDPNQTYPKTNLTSSTYHTMKPVNGSLLGVNKDKLFLVGYDESYTNEALQLLPQSIGKTLLDDGLGVIVCVNMDNTKEESWLYFWDGASLAYNDRMSLPFKDINAIIQSEVKIIQYGSDGQLYFFGDTARLPITAFPGGGQVKPSGVTLDNGLALFGVYGNDESRQSGVYTYGRKRKNADFALNLEYPLVCDSIDAIEKVGSDILIAYTSGSTYGVKKVDTANKITEAIYESLDLKAPPASVGSMPVFSSVVLDMAPLPTGCSVEVWRKLDKVDTGGSSGWYQANTQDGSLAFDTVGGMEAVFNLEDSAKVLEIRVVLNCYSNSTPEIYKIQAFFA